MVLVPEGILLAVLLDFYGYLLIILARVYRLITDEMGSVDMASKVW